MNNNLNKKNKFIENLNIEFNKQPYYDIQNMTTDINDTIKSNFNAKHKSKLELKERLDPYEYDLSYYDPLRKDTKGQEFIYYAPFDQGPGRGFGDLNISNNIRNREASRSNTEIFKIIREGDLIDRFDYIDDRFQQVENLVFPYPRSGEMSRKIPESTDTNINNYKFNVPKNELNFITNSIDKQIPTNSTDKQVQLPPNTNLIENIEHHNYDQKLKQKKYLEELHFIESVIEFLKKKYGSSLTKEIIQQKLDEIKKQNINIDTVTSQEAEKQNNVKFDYSV